MNQYNENTSGMGKDSIVPPEIEGWSWGAFLLNWIWGIGNSTYIALLVFVPIVNIAMMFVLGAKGNKWAWQNRAWKDVDHFKKTQKKWSIAGAVIVLVVLPLFVVSIFSLLRGEAFELSLKAVKKNEQVIQLVGIPLESSLLITGKVQTSGASGTAQLHYSISGPKDDAEVKVMADKELGSWNLREVVVYNNESNLNIQVIPTRE